MLAGEGARQEIGSLLRQFRKAQKHTQKEFAARLGVSQAFLCDVEQGRRMFGEETVQKLEELLFPQGMVTGEVFRQGDGWNL